MKLACPQCGVAISPADVNVAQDVFSCASCDEAFTLSATVGRATRRPRPAHSKVEFVADQESLGLIIPPGNNRSTAWFFLMFSALWNAITWTILITIVIKGGSDLFGGLFLIPFVLIGAVTAVACLYGFKGQFTLSIDRQECRAIWSLFRWNHTRVARTADIVSIDEEVIYSQNNRPVYGLAIRHGGKDGKPAKTIKFGSGLKDDERDWLIGEIRSFVQAPRAVA